MKMKKIVPLTLASLILLTGCGSTHTTKSAYKNATIGNIIKRIKNRYPQITEYFPDKLGKSHLLVPSRYSPQSKIPVTLVTTVRSSKKNADSFVVGFKEKWNNKEHVWVFTETSKSVTEKSSKGDLAPQSKG